MSQRGIRVWEVIVAVLLIGGGLVFFVTAAERVRWRGHAVIPTRDMRDILQAGDRFHDEHRKWPTRPEDLKPYMTKPTTYEALIEGWYIVVWDAFPKEQPGDLPLVYQKNAPTNGGYICYRDGRVGLLTAEEAKAVLLAGKE